MLEDKLTKWLASSCKERQDEIAWNKIKMIMLQSARKAHGVMLIGSMKNVAWWNDEGKGVWMGEKPYIRE